MQILALCSSPKKDGKSNTELFLNHLAQGMGEAGGEVRIVNLRDKSIKTCQGCFNCWTKTPGRCIQKDDMTRELMPLVPASDLVIYATPLYHRTMTATMSNFLERLLPLFLPFSERHDGGISRKLRQKLPPVAWLSVCGHPELSEFAALSQFLNSTRNPDTPIVAEIYRTSTEALQHPVFRQQRNDILEATIQAGRELVQQLCISEKTMACIQQPLNDLESLFMVGNLTWQTCIDEKITLQEFFEKGMKPRPDSMETFMALCLYSLNTQAVGHKKVILQFKFSGAVTGACYFSIQNGKIEPIIGTSDAFDIAIETPFETWMDIMTGRADGRDMYMQEKYHVQGDLALMVELFRNETG